MISPHAVVAGITADVEALADRVRAAEAENARHQRSADLLHDDLRDLLDALGAFSGARPESPHEVMRAAITEAARLRAQVADAVALVDRSARAIDQPGDQAGRA